MKNELTRRKLPMREKDGLAVDLISDKDDHRSGKRFRCRRFAGSKVVIGIFLLVISAYLVLTKTNMRSHRTLRVETSHNPRRFPKFGTDEFTRRCNWTLPAAAITSDEQKPACSIHVTPAKNSNEGLSWWVSEIAEAFIYMKYEGKNCKLLLDYGKNVDLSQVVIPPPTDTAFDWRVPLDFNCQRGQCRLTNWIRSFHRGNTTRLDQHVPIVLNFRFAYAQAEHFWRYRDSFLEVESKIPGYHPELGVACSLSALLHLSPRASRYEPQLFTQFLPTLQDVKTLVLSLYMRTGRTDEVVHFEQNKSIGLKEETQKTYESTISAFEKCAYALEERYMAESSFDRVVWMLVTDSPFLKDYMPKTYRGTVVPQGIPRQVLTTKSRGRHTKPNHNVQSDDFAEAFIDWYLIGESDAVIVDKKISTFGPTGALRTARPLYWVKDVCAKPLTLIHDAVPAEPASKSS